MALLDGAGINVSLHVLGDWRNGRSAGTIGCTVQLATTVRHA
jgi:hypothetical protein